MSYFEDYKREELLSDDYLEEKLRNELRKNGYIDRKEFAAYLRESPFKDRDEKEKGFFRKLFGF